MGEQLTCGDCRWWSGHGDDWPDRCRGGRTAVRLWPTDAACKSMLALMEAERERDEARELVREVGVAGMQLAGEMMTATDGWLVCLWDFGDLFLDCERAERGWDGAKAENERLRAWAAGRPCEHPIKTDHLGIDPDTGSAAGWVEKRCGKCMPCLCKAVIERGE